ncbi:MAG: bacillithiol biosynthesis BshC, partial [Gemmatimonadota bacterium]|nr:bacillithiol biosynthesis BshC [Gemmatimonadota bacterium]
MNAPLLEPTALGSPESLAGALLARRGPIEFPEAPGRRPPGEPARIRPSAFGTTSGTLAAKLERVLAGEGLVVTTGQQPVLFLGPLYVLYKALSAIVLAEELESRLDVPVVPVFWIASDDHDIDEIGRTSVLDAGGEIRTLELDREGRTPGRPVGPMRIGASGAALTDELSQLLPPSEFRDSYLTVVRDSYRADATVSGAFAAALSGVLEGREYAWLDSAHPEAKTASAPLFRRMLEHPVPVLDALKEGDRSLADAGF